MNEFNIKRSLSTSVHWTWLIIMSLKSHMKHVPLALPTHDSLLILAPLFICSDISKTQPAAVALPELISKHP